MNNERKGDSVTYELHCGDCLEIMPTLESGSVNLACIDFPYFGVKENEWDNQWNSRNDFLLWIGAVCDEVKRLLAPNGSFYAFASPQMAWHVEGVIREQFNVLNQIVWKKEGGTRANQSDKDILRCCFGDSERIIFSENGDSDTIADEIAGFTRAETELKKRIFGDYLKVEFKRAGVNNHQVTGAIGAYREHNHGGAASNWLLGLNVPTPEQYQSIRNYLNSLNHGGDYLRREYEDLRREYEDLRRPFNATPDAPYTDVWTFPTVQAYPGKHPTEKPVSLIEHIVKLSSRTGDVVFDCCMGHGTTGIAAGKLKRKFIGIEQDAGYFANAQKRIAAAYGDWDKAMSAKRVFSDKNHDMPLFAMAAD